MDFIRRRQNRLGNGNVRSRLENGSKRKHWRDSRGENKSYQKFVRRGTFRDSLQCQTVIGCMCVDFELRIFSWHEFLLIVSRVAFHGNTRGCLANENIDVKKRAMWSESEFTSRIGDRWAANASCFSSLSSFALIEFNMERIFLAKF